eukprot:2710135-Rhodomonas_salina.2
MMHSALAACPDSMTGRETSVSPFCWIVYVTLRGALPGDTKRALYLYGARAGPIRPPCSLTDAKCECLANVVDTFKFHATTVTR